MTMPTEHDPDPSPVRTRSEYREFVAPLPGDVMYGSSDGHVIVSTNDGTAALPNTVKPYSVPNVRNSIVGEVGYSYVCALNIEFQASSF